MIHLELATQRVETVNMVFLKNCFKHSSDNYFDNFLIGIALAKGIKEIGSVDAFIIMFKVRETKKNTTMM